MKRLLLVTVTVVVLVSMPVAADSDETPRVRSTEGHRYAARPPVIVGSSYSPILPAVPDNPDFSQLSRQDTYALPKLQRYVETATASAYPAPPLRMNVLLDSNEKTLSLGADILVGKQTVLKAAFRKVVEDKGYDGLYLELGIRF